MCPTVTTPEYRFNPFKLPRGTVCVLRQFCDREARAVRILGDWTAFDGAFSIL